MPDELHQVAGGLRAFWLVRGGQPLEQQPIVFFGSEGELGVVARNLDDYLWLLSGGFGPSEAVMDPDTDRELNMELAGLAARATPPPRRSRRARSSGSRTRSFWTSSRRSAPSAGDAQRSNVACAPATRASAVVVAVVAAVAAPLIALAMWRSRVRAWPPLVAVLGLLALDNMVLHLPRGEPLASLQWNWQGKLLEVAWVLVLVAVVPRLSLRDIGLTAPLRPNWLGPTLVLGGVTLALPFAFLLLGARDTLTVEGWAFEATMPGIAEELVYRGVLLELCDRALGRPWRIAGADVGWGVIITAVIFAAGHAIAVDRSGALQIEPLLAVGPLVGSLLAGWARSRLGTLAPLIIIHNASNLVIPLATLWLSI